MKYVRKFSYVGKKTESPKYLRKKKLELSVKKPKHLKTTCTGYMYSRVISSQRSGYKKPLLTT